MYLPRIFVAGSLLFLICACGGGGGSDAVFSGQFIDSAVTGVRYSTQTRSGVTNSEGMFEYQEGETVRFYLGDLLLGEADGAGLVSLFDLVDGATPVVGGALKIAIWDSVAQPGFSSVINLAILLQTLDSDGDPENGIDIAPEVAALFASGSVDINQHWRDFAYDRGFTRAMAEAKARELLDSQRQARKPWHALAHLYNSLNVDNQLRVESTTSGDTDGDGSPDYTILYEYDAEGKLSREVYNSTGSETVRIEEYRYDAEGNLTLAELDDDSDGLPDEVVRYTYDADGNQTSRAKDSYGIGVWDDVYTFSYDAYRNRTREERDRDGDGSADRITTEIYNAEGNVERYEWDSDGDGIPEEIQTHSYSADGDKIQTVFTAEIAGPPQKIYTYIHSADGLTVRMEYDEDADGTPDAVETHIGEADGSERRMEYDGTYGDGVLESITTYRYDGNGREIRYERDRDADGLPDSIGTRTYDSDGYETLYTHDSNGNGTPEQTHTITHDSAGYEILRELDLTSDGAADKIFSTSYDSSAVGWWWVFNRGAPRRSRQWFTLTPSEPGSGGYGLVITTSL